LVTHSSFIEGSHPTKNTASGNSFSVEKQGHELSDQLDLIDDEPEKEEIRFLLLIYFLDYFISRHIVCHNARQGAQYLTGENLKVVWAEFSTLS
jgi:hypothetical protein